MFYTTSDGIKIPAVKPSVMGMIDELAITRFHMHILQMMENAGRSCAEQITEMTDGKRGPVAVLAGAGRNGGGGLCCARHLINMGYMVEIILDRQSKRFKGPVKNQYDILAECGAKLTDTARTENILAKADVVVDALIGYGLHGIPIGETSELIVTCNKKARRILSLDIPSGINAENGQILGPAIQPERVLTWTLPKTGMKQVPGDLYLADIGIPKKLLESLDFRFPWPFADRFAVKIHPAGP